MTLHPLPLIMQLWLTRNHNCMIDTGKGGDRW